MANVNNWAIHLASELLGNFREGAYTTRNHCNTTISYSELDSTAAMAHHYGNPLGQEEEVPLVFSAGSVKEQQELPP